MIIDSTYEFERSKKDPSLYRFRYYYTKALSSRLAPKIWKPWSRWLTLPHLKKHLHGKREKGHTFKLHDLKDIPPGTKKIMSFKKEHKEKNLHMWNKPKDIGRIRKKRVGPHSPSRYSRLIRSNERYASGDFYYDPPPQTADDVLADMRALFERVSENEFYSRLENMFSSGLFDLSQEEKEKFSEARKANDVNTALTVITPGIQNLIDDRRTKGQVEAKRSKFRKDENGFVVQTENGTYNVDMKNRTCTCPDYKIIGFWGFFCKHLYGAVNKDNGP